MADHPPNVEDDPPKIVCCFFVVAKCSEKNVGLSAVGLSAVRCFKVLGPAHSVQKFGHYGCRNPDNSNTNVLRSLYRGRYICKNIKQMPYWLFGYRKFLIRYDIGLKYLRYLNQKILKQYRIISYRKNKIFRYFDQKYEIFWYFNQK